MSYNLDSVTQTTGSDCVMILGDFNVHHQKWLGSKSFNDRAGIACFILCLTHGLDQLVKDTTRGDNLLDLVIIDSATYYITSVKVKANIRASD